MASAVRERPAWRLKWPNESDPIGPVLKGPIDVYWVSLTDVADPGDVGPAMASALGFSGPVAQDTVPLLLRGPWGRAMCCWSWTIASGSGPHAALWSLSWLSPALG